MAFSLFFTNSHDTIYAVNNISVISVILKVHIRNFYYIFQITFNGISHTINSALFEFSASTAEMGVPPY